jgi:hypothetical protein
LPSPTKASHSLAGWFASPDGNGERYDASTIILKDATLYAKWAAIPKESPAPPQPAFNWTDVAPTAPISATLSTSETSAIIKAALEKGLTPLIELTEGKSGAYFSGASLLDCNVAGKDADIRKGNATASLSPFLVSEWEAKSGAQVKASWDYSKSKPSESLVNDLISLDKGNETLIQDIKTLKIDVDKTAITETAFPIKVSVDVSKLTPYQKGNLTGILLDSSLSSYKILGGRLSSDKTEFIFHTYGTGNLSVIISSQVLKLRLTIGQTPFGKNGESLSSDVTPYIAADNRTMLPVRAIAEALGAFVSWNGETKTATAAKDGKSASITLGRLLPNGLGAPAIVQDKFFVPIRCIAELLDANVVWDDSERSVSIYR